MAVRISRLKLSNWRNFRHVDIQMSERVFVVGPNAAGKTNLLDALRFLRDIAVPGGSLVRAVDTRNGVTHIRSLHAGGPGSNAVVVEVEVLVDDDKAPWTYRLAITGSERKNKPLYVAEERVTHGDVQIFCRPDEFDHKDSALLAQTHLEQISQNKNFRVLAEALASVAHIHIVPQVAKSVSRTEEISKKDAPGSDFIDQLARLSDAQQKKRLKRIESALRIAVPQFSRLEVERDELGRPHLRAKYDHWRRRAAWQSEQEFSDGTLRLIGLLWAIDEGDTPLILEEPELSLHREVIRQLPRIFARVAKRTGRQVLVSTHAEEMIEDEGVSPREVVLLKLSENETKVVCGDQEPTLVQAAQAGLSLGRIVNAMTKPKNVEQLSLPGL